MVKTSTIIVTMLWIVAAILQLSVFSNMRIGSYVPNFILALLVLLALRNCKEDVIWLGVLVTGIILDIFRQGRLGETLISLLCIACAVLWLRSRVLRTPSWMIAILSVFLSSIVFNIIFILITRTFSLEVIKAALGSGIYTVMVGLVLVIILHFLDQLMRRSSHEPIGGVA